MKLRNIFNQLKSETDGNVSIMFGVSFVAILTLIGAVFDLMILNKNKQHVQYLTDAAALAALQFNGTIEEREAVFADHVQTLNRLSTGEDLKFRSSIEIVEVDGTLQLTAQLTVPHDLVLLQHLGGPESISLSTSAEKGIGNVEIALVLDISSSMNGARITEAKAAATLFVEQLLDDEGLNERIAISLVPFGGTVRVPVELSTLLDTPLEDLEDYSQHWIDQEWNQCFEYDLEDTRDGISPDGTYRVTPDFSSYSRRNPWCPISGNELIPLTDEKNLLLDRIDALTLSDGTGSDHGMAWGIETLNPAWRGRFPGALPNTPATQNSQTKKVLIFMTDGGITAQHQLTEEGLESGNAVPVDTRDFRNGRTLIPTRDTRLAFDTACGRAKTNDIDIFTIGFNLANDSVKTPLENCATIPAQYIDARTGDLNGIFERLANEISPLRVTN